MSPYIGDRPLDPPEDDDEELGDGMPDMSDPGEPNDDFDEDFPW